MCPLSEDKRAMGSVAFDFSAQSFVRRLEDRERERLCVPFPVARRSVSRRIGVAAGTLENLRRGRIKGVREWVLAALRAALVAEIEADIARAKHELQILRASDRRVDQSQISEVEAGLCSLLAVLKGDQND
jgi:hypothetical protein